MCGQQMHGHQLLLIRNQSKRLEPQVFVPGCVLQPGLFHHLEDVLETHSKVSLAVVSWLCKVFLSVLQKEPATHLPMVK